MPQHSKTKEHHLKDRVPHKTQAASIGRQADHRTPSHHVYDDTPSLYKRKCMSLAPPRKAPEKDNRRHVLEELKEHIFDTPERAALLGASVDNLTALEQNYRNQALNDLRNPNLMNSYSNSLVSFPGGNQRPGAIFRGKNSQP